MLPHASARPSRPFGAGSGSKKTGVKGGKKEEKLAKTKGQGTSNTRERKSKRSATKDPVDYWEGESSQVEEDEAEGGDTNPLEIGMVCMTADPRCLDLHEHDEGADVWLSTAQMGWALGEESMEVEAPDEVSGKK